MSIKLLELDPQRRDAILNSALKEFSMQGYDNASTNIIAKNAGISIKVQNPRIFFRHFNLQKVRLTQSSENVAFFVIHQFKILFSDKFGKVIKKTAHQCCSDNLDCLFFDCI